MPLESIEQNEGTPGENRPEEEKKESGKYRAPLLLIGVTVLLASALGYFYAFPNYRDATAAMQNVAEQTQLREQRTQELAKAKEDALKPREFTKEEQAASELLPDEADVPNLIRLLERMSYLDTASTLDDTYLSSFNIGSPADTKSYKTLSINGAFSSTRFSLAEIIRRFENSTERIFNISTISVSLASRTESETVSIFSDALQNTQYQILLAKRQSFLLTEEERDQLTEMQYEIENEYNNLLRKRNRLEQEESRLKSLKTELDSLHSEATYSLSVHTFIDSKKPETAPAQ